jgi:hypothetical protein
MSWKERLKGSKIRFKLTKMRLRIPILDFRLRLSPLMEKCSRAQHSLKSLLRRKRGLYSLLRERALMILMRAVDSQRGKRSHSIRLRRTRPIK